MQVAGFLCIDGVELVNHSRTFTYLRRGLGGQEWQVALAPLYTEIPYTDIYLDDYYELGGDEPGGYEETYSSYYTNDEFSPSRLRCFCPLISDAQYVDPATDAAPWYLASRPASAEFLGVLLNDLDDRPPVTRTVTRWASGGASMGRKIPTERTAGFDVTLVASSSRGMEYGRRWLAEVVSGGMCSDDASEFTILPACPDEPDDHSALRRYARAGLIDGPTFSREDEGTAECHAMRGRWQIAAGVPFLLSPPVVVEDIPRTLLPGETASLLLEADEWVGDVAARLSLEASTYRATDITVRAYPLAEGQDCPEPGTPSACHEFTVAELAAYGVLQIDSALEEVTWHNPTTKQPEAGWALLDFTRLWSWLTVPPCSSVCVQVTNGGDVGAVQVTLEAVTREL